jgi:hypothetical protein
VLPLVDCVLVAVNSANWCGVKLETFRLAEIVAIVASSLGARVAPGDV